MSLRRSAGLALLELVVAFALLMLALALGTSLLLESQRRAAANARVRDAVPLDAIVARMRRDLVDAGGAAGGSLWTPDRMVLQIGIEQVEWRLEEDVLLRVHRDALGAESQAVMPGILTFRWRQPSAGFHPLVEVEIVARAEARVVGLAQRRRGPTTERRAFRAMLRGLETGAW